MLLKSARLSDADLKNLVILRDKAGAEALYDQYANALLLVIFRIVPEKARAYIILELAFVQIWNSFECYSVQEQRLFTWMVGIARNIAIQSQAGSPLALIA